MFFVGNLTHLKSQECLRRVKSEIRSQNRFSSLYVDDIATTQQYFRYLLPDSPFPGYVQYFVQDPFIVHMYVAGKMRFHFYTIIMGYYYN